MELVVSPSSVVGGALALGEAVDGVVHDDGANVQVSRGLGGDVLHADAEEVPVAGDDDHVQVGASHLHAHRDGEASAVDAVEAVGLVAFEEMDEVAGAADARDDHVVFDGYLIVGHAVRHGLFEGASHGEVAAAGAPLEVVFGVLGAHTVTIPFWMDLTLPPTRFTRSLTLKGRPVYWVMASAFTPWERRTEAHWPW